MALTPEDVDAKTFGIVKRDGLDPLEVRRFLDAISAELRARASALAAAHHTNERLTDELRAAAEVRPAASPDADTVSRWVAELIASSETDAADVVRLAELEAARIHADAQAYAERIRSDADEVRDRTLADIESFRQDTIAYAEQVRAEAEREVEQRRAASLAELDERRSTMLADVAARSDAVRVTEAQLLGQLIETADGISDALRRFRHADAPLGHDPLVIDLRDGAADAAAEPAGE